MRLDWGLEIFDPDERSHTVGFGTQFPREAGPYGPAEKGECTMSDRYLVISADDHAGPPLPAFRPYFERSERDDFDRYWKGRPMASAAESAARGDLDALASALVLFMKASGAGDEAARGFAGAMKGVEDHFSMLMRGVKDQETLVMANGGSVVAKEGVVMAW